MKHFGYAEGCQLLAAATSINSHLKDLDTCSLAINLIKSATEVITMTETGGKSSGTWDDSNNSDQGRSSLEHGQKVKPYMRLTSSECS